MRFRYSLLCSIGGFFLLIGGKFGMDALVSINWRSLSPLRWSRSTPVASESESATTVQVSPSDPSILGAVPTDNSTQEMLEEHQPEQGSPSEEGKSDEPPSNGQNEDKGKVEALPAEGVNSSNSEPAKSPSDDKWEGEHFPQTRLRLLEQSEVDAMTFPQVRYAINEAYARHGVTFRTSYIRNQFLKLPWYKPVEGRYAEDAVSMLTEVEQDNVKRLAKRKATLEKSGNTGQ